MSIYAPPPGPWTAYTPVITGSGSNPNIGSTGTITGRYVQIGKTVHFEAQITVGGSGISAGSGNYSITLPVTAESTFITANAYKFVGQANIFNSPSTNFLGIPQIATTTTMQLVLWTVATLAVGGVLALGLWGSGAAGIASGNITTITGTYEAA